MIKRYLYDGKEVNILVTILHVISVNDILNNSNIIYPLVTDGSGIYFEYTDKECYEIFNDNNAVLSKVSFYNDIKELIGKLVLNTIGIKLLNVKVTEDRVIIVTDEAIYNIVKTNSTITEFTEDNIIVLPFSEYDPDYYFKYKPDITTDEINTKTRILVNSIDTELIKSYNSFDDCINIPRHISEIHILLKLDTHNIIKSKDKYIDNLYLYSKLFSWFNFEIKVTAGNIHTEIVLKFKEVTYDYKKIIHDCILYGIDLVGIGFDINKTYNYLININMDNLTTKFYTMYKY